MRTEREIDEAIDRAVSDIMSGEPRAGFGARVLQRLAPARQPWPGTLPLAAAAAAIVVVLAGLLLYRASSSPPAPDVVATAEPPAATPSVPVAAGPAAAVEPPRPIDPPPERPAPPKPFAERRGVAAASVDETITFGSATGSSPKMVIVDGAPAPPIAIEPIRIAPLSIPPLAIEPITPQ